MIPKYFGDSCIIKILEWFICYQMWWLGAHIFVHIKAKHTFRLHSQKPVYPLSDLRQFTSWSAILLLSAFLRQNSYCKWERKTSTAGWSLNQHVFFFFFSPTVWINCSFGVNTFQVLYINNSLASCRWADESSHIQTRVWGWFWMDGWMMGRTAVDVICEIFPVLTRSLSRNLLKGLAINL